MWWTSSRCPPWRVEIQLQVTKHSRSLPCCVCRGDMSQDFHNSFRMFQPRFTANHNVLRKPAGQAALICLDYFFHFQGSASLLAFLQAIIGFAWDHVARLGRMRMQLSRCSAWFVIPCHPLRYYYLTYVFYQMVIIGNLVVEAVLKTARGSRWNWRWMQVALPSTTFWHASFRVQRICGGNVQRIVSNSLVSPEFLRCSAGEAEFAGVFLLCWHIWNLGFRIS